MFLFVLFILLIYPAYAGRRLIPHEISVIMWFAIIYLGGTSLLSGVSPRHSMLVVPAVSLWIIFTLMRALEFRIAEP
jgi:hypothetical protein